MPVRIYDISKKLGLENKEVLSKAKELGITTARVASSSLDKITAEYLEQQLILAHPERAAAQVLPPAAVTETVPPAASNGPLIISAPAPTAETTQIQEPTTVTVTSTTLLEAQPAHAPAAPPGVRPQVEARATEPPAAPPV